MASSHDMICFSKYSKGRWLVISCSCYQAPTSPDALPAPAMAKRRPGSVKERMRRREKKKKEKKEEEEKRRKKEEKSKKAKKKAKTSSSSTSSIPREWRRRPQARTTGMGPG